MARFLGPKEAQRRDGRNTCEAADATRRLKDALPNTIPACCQQNLVASALVRGKGAKKGMQSQGHVTGD